MTRWAQLASRFGERADVPRPDPQAWGFMLALPPRQPLLAACSGGADSVFLVLLLLARLPAAAGRLHVVHFHHGLRGADADADAAFVADMATGLGLPFLLGRPDQPLAADEAVLRAARYAWMEQIYREHAAGGLCLGHHADDLLESQLMALLSGNGPAGLASPAPVKRFADGHVRLRPLLGLRRGRIEQSLRAAGIAWREDPSNRDPRHTRNWLRAQIMPLLKARFPQDVYAATARTRLLMEEAVVALDDAADRLRMDFSDPDRLDARALRGQPRAVARRSVLAWWLRHRPQRRLPAAALDRLLDHLQGDPGLGVVAVGSGQVLQLDAGGCLRLQPEMPRVPPAWPAAACWHWPAGPLYLPEGGMLRGLAVCAPTAAEPPWRHADPRREAWLDGAPDTLLVRQWRPGDRYRPLGAPGRRKLQDLFVDAGLAVPAKHLLPVLTGEDGEILWVPGFPPAECARVPAGCKAALQLTYQPH